MKQITVLLASLIVAVGISSVITAADSPQNPGPEIIRFKMGELYLPFKHWKHQKLQDSTCKSCHSTQEWKIEAWGKEVAHEMCISCHERREKGPVVCKECHGAAYSSIRQYRP